MKLSTRARYGLRMCFLMALSEESVTLHTLVKQTDLSMKYLEQILLKLKKRGIIKTYRGVNGGYSLIRSPSEITIKQILDSLDDGLDFTDCVVGKCGDTYCPNRKIFTRIYESVNGVLDTFTLQDMVDDYKCVK